MIKTLYTRMVLVYLAAVIFGLVVAFVIMGLVFSERLNAQLREDMTLVAQDLIETYEATDNVDFDSYMTNRKLAKPFFIRVYDEAGNEAQYGYTDVETRKVITPQEIAQVLRGEKLWNESNMDVSILGYPVKIQGHSYAMFLQPASNKSDRLLQSYLNISLINALIIGSVFIMVAGRYLVKPIKRMTKAARRMAKGDFNIGFDWKFRKDELGELAQSFTEMAGELKQMERMRQDFVSNVSHEIQSPLTSIAGFSKLLREKAMSEEERRQYLEIIQTEAERLSRLSENLLKLASLESEHHPFHPTTYALDEQLRSVIVATEPIWSAKKLELDLTLPTAKINADADQLSQVWMNLITNSLKFTPEGGMVRVRLLPGTDRIQVRIGDTGIGISEEDQARIFERFYKADRARNREKSGSGLGLAIVKKIVDLHHGTIEVRSKPGQGTVFTVTLPSFSGKRHAPDKK